MTTWRRPCAAALHGAAVFFFAIPALADGEPKSFAAPAPPFSWTGFYVGAQLGGLGNSSDISDPLGASIFGNPNVATGAFVGGQAGYNYQSGMMVYGLEADIALPQVEGTST
ncbi:MAG: hypothetical protein WC829_17205, partial [Hyphomicrobium sp.]